MIRPVAWILAFLAVVAGAPRPAAAQTPSPTSVAILPIKAEGLPKRNLPLLEEALVTAAAEHLDRSAMAAADVREALKPAELKQALACEAAGCWQKAGERLSVAYVLAVDVTLSGKKLLLSLKLVDVAAKKVVARYQQPVDNEPTEYLGAAQAALTEIRTRAGLGTGPAPVAATPTPPVATTPTPAPTPVPVAAAAEPPAPTPAVEPPETPFDAKWPLPPPPATGADAKSLLPANQALTHAGDAEWAEGIGFVRKDSAALGEMPSAAVSAVTIPSVSGASFDESLLTLGVYRVSWNPSINGVDAMTKAAVGVEGRIRFMHEWRQANWFVAPWLDLQMFMGGGYITTPTQNEARFASFHGMGRFGLDLHPIPPESYRGLLALGPFGGLAPRFITWGVDKTDATIQRRYDERFGTVEGVVAGGDKQQNEFNIDAIYGGHVRLRTPEHPGDPSMFWLDGAYYFDRPTFYADSTIGAKATYLSAELGMNASGFRLAVHVIYRLSTQGTINLNNRIEMLDTMPEAFSLGIGIGGDV